MRVACSQSPVPAAGPRPGAEAQRQPPPRDACLDPYTFAGRRASRRIRRTSSSPASHARAAGAACPLADAGDAVCFAWRGRGPRGDDRHASTAKRKFPRQLGFFPFIHRDASPSAIRRHRLDRRVFLRATRALAGSPVAANPASAAPATSQSAHPSPLAQSQSQRRRLPHTPR